VPGLRINGDVLGEIPSGRARHGAEPAPVSGPRHLQQAGTRGVQLTVSADGR
jgi:hypothetical protein